MGRCTELCTKEITGSCVLCEALAERERFVRVYLGGWLIECTSALCKSIITSPWYRLFAIIRDGIVESPIAIATLVLVLATIFVITLTLVFNNEGYNEELFKNILAEAHGMLLDILVIGIFILWLNKKGEKKLESKRYLEEIDDFRGWKSDEASHRIAGNIKRLNRNGVTNLDLSHCYLVKAQLGKARLREAILRDAALSKAALSGADLQGADLRRAALSGADLRRAALSGADLQGALLPEANLREANLREANLRETDLHEADLYMADLRGAALCEANLRGAYLYRADLRGADLREADLREANLREANLRVTDLRGANLRGARYNSQTTWPEGFDYCQCGAVLS